MNAKINAFLAGKGILVVAAFLAATTLILLLSVAVLQWRAGRPGFMVIWAAGIAVLTAALRPAYKLLCLQHTANKQ